MAIGNMDQHPDVGKRRNTEPRPGVESLTPLEKLPFHLQNGEKIMRELKPQFGGFMLTRALGSYIGILLLAIAIMVGAILLKQVPDGFLIEITLIPFLILVVSIVPFISYGKSWYWITTHRVIGKSGCVGYSIDSIPLSNVNDIVLARTLLDRMLGLSSLMIVPFGGSDSRTSTFGSNDMTQGANFFPALPQKIAKELQRVLFNLRDELRDTQIVQPISGASTPVSAELAQPENIFARGIK